MRGQRKCAGSDGRFGSGAQESNSVSGSTLPVGRFGNSGNPCDDGCAGKFPNSFCKRFYYACAFNSEHVQREFNVRKRVRHDIDTRETSRGCSDGKIASRRHRVSLGCNPFANTKNGSAGSTSETPNRSQ